MIPRSYSTSGIVLAKKNYGEADRILSIYTQDFGRISLIAKGVRKMASRKRGHIEVFNNIRFQGIRGKGIDLITEAETIDSFKEFRENLKKVSLAYYFMEVIGRTTHEGEPHPEIYNLILGSLSKLREEKKLKTLRLDFILKLLTILGFWPEGKILVNPDAKLQEVVERNINSIRVGKRILE